MIMKQLKLLYYALLTLVVSCPFSMVGQEADTVFVDGLKYLAFRERHVARVIGYERGITKAEVPVAFYYNGYRYKVNMIEHSAFKDCTSLTSFKWERVDECLMPGGESNAVICWGAFQGCTALKSFIINDNIWLYTTNSLFKDCISLQSICLPSSRFPLNIGDHMFEGCVNLVAADFGNHYFGFSWVGPYAFAECRSLKQISLRNLTHISSNAFDGCINLENVYDCDDVYQIDSCAFRNCKSLKLMDLPAIETLWENTFRNCTSLQVVNVGKEAIQIPYYSFINCPSLREINVAEGNPNFVTINGSLYSNRQLTMLTIALPKYMKRFYIAEGTERVSAWAFEGCDQLKFLYMPSSLRVFNGPLSNSVKTIVSDGGYYLSSWYVDDFDRGECSLYVPASSWKNYVNRSPWDAFKEIIPMRDANGNGVIDIDDITTIIEILLGVSDIEDYSSMLTGPDEVITIDAIAEMIDLLLNQ